MPDANFRNLLLYALGMTLIVLVARERMKNSTAHSNPAPEDF